MEELKNYRISNDQKNVRNNVLMYPTLNGRNEVNMKINNQIARGGNPLLCFQKLDLMKGRNYKKINIPNTQKQKENEKKNV